MNVEPVEGNFAISKLQVAKDFALARLAALVPHKNSGITLPLAVRREFARMVAVKVLAWIGEDGYPSVIPMLSLQPAGQRSLACWQGSSRLPSPPAEAMVATNILTFEAIPYQAKGHWSARGRQGAIAVQDTMQFASACAFLTFLRA